jgi:glutathione synthase/RimK-type ligase-like ATP-grasp enzyme
MSVQDQPVMGLIGVLRRGLTLWRPYRRSIVEEHPVIIKPYNGGRGIGIRIVERSRELAKSRPPTEPVVVQEYIRHDDEVKVYVIGEEVFGIRTRPGDGRRWSCPISDEVRRPASSRCACPA